MPDRENPSPQCLTLRSRRANRETHIPQIHTVNVFCQQSPIGGQFASGQTTSLEHESPLTMPGGQSLEPQVTHQSIHVGGLSDFDCDPTKVIDRRRRLIEQ